MDLQHRFTVPTGVEETWAHFQDIASVAECFPGATVSSVEEDSFSGSVKVKLGPIALVYNGSGTFVEKDEAAHRFVVEAKGKDKRGNGTAGATVTLTMTGSDGGADGATDVEVLTDLSITGKPAQFGRGVMQDVSDKLLGQFVSCLESRLSGPAEGAGTATDGAAGSSAVDADAGPASQPTGAAAATPGTGADQDAGPASAPGPDGASPRGDAPHGAGTAATTGAGSDDSLDLGATVLPVLAKSYWKQAAGVLGVLVVLWWLVSRRRS